MAKDTEAKAATKEDTSELLWQRMDDLEIRLKVAEAQIAHLAARSDELFVKSAADLADLRRDILSGKAEIMPQGKTQVSLTRRSDKFLGKDGWIVPPIDGEKGFEEYEANPEAWRRRMMEQAA